MIGNLFRRKADPLAKRASDLALMVRAGSVGIIDPFREKCPTLRHVSEEKFEFLFVIASVYLTSAMLHQLGLEPGRALRLFDSVMNGLEKLYPTTGNKAFDHCAEFFERNYAGLQKIGHDEKLLVADSIGGWLMWEILERAPDSDAEWKTVRMLGLNVTREAAAWWTD